MPSSNARPGPSIWKSLTSNGRAVLLGPAAAGTDPRARPAVRAAPKEPWLTATETEVPKVHPPRLGQRRSGLLLHPTSLPGPHGSGDLGPAAVHFVDELARTGQSWWQMLPVGPAGFGNSPYSALSAFAGNPLLISLDWLAEEGLLDAGGLAEAARVMNLPRDRVEFGGVIHHRNQRLQQAFEAFQRRGKGGGELSREAFDAFCERERAWLD